MGFPDQPQGQGQPVFPGDPWKPGQQPGPPGFAGGSGYQPQQPGQRGAKNNNLAIASLICGVAQFLLWWVFLIPGLIAAILALIFGFISMRQMKKRAEGGRGMAIAGLVLGGLGVIGGIIVIVLFAIGSAISFHYHVGN